MPLWQAVFGYNGGALSYYALFYRSRLVPRWLSGWGMAGVVLLMTACLQALFSDNLVTRYTLLILPIALHEMALAVWLLVKGFGPASHPSSGRVHREGPAVTANCTSETRQHRFPYLCDDVVMNLRASIFGPASTKTQAVVGAVVAFALALLIGFGLEQGADSAVFTALLVGLAVLMIGLKRSRTARR